jgi:hypothetical protein
LSQIVALKLIRCGVTRLECPKLTALTLLDCSKLKELVLPSTVRSLEMHGCKKLRGLVGPWPPILQVDALQTVSRVCVF